ncbi:MAG: SCP2 sterol-binding domain-containing protein [Ilumatobacteraceae bacterium]
MAHPFLSEEWMAAVREIRSRYRGRTIKITQSIKMNQVITGAPLGDGTIHSFLDTSSGEVVMGLGSLPDPEVTITTDYQTARKIFLEQDPTAAMIALMSGFIKVDGDIVKMMTMQEVIPQDDIGKEVARQILAITS